MTDSPSFDSFLQRLGATTETINLALQKLMQEDEDKHPALARLHAAMRHSVLGSGKRLRAFLVLHIAEILGTDYARSMRAAIAIEFVHCYSLVHDDLPAMDDDDFRRGKPTIHKAFNEATAILTGDALLTKAFLILSDTQTHPEAGIRCKLINTLSQGALDMVKGQMIDMNIEDGGLEAISLMVELKTAALIQSACMMGTILGKGDPKAYKNFADYGKALGVAFQIRDDVLDIIGDEHKMGKPTHKDATTKKKTSLAAWSSSDVMQEKAEFFVARAIDAIKRDKKTFSPFLESLAIFSIKREH